MGVSRDVSYEFLLPAVVLQLDRPVDRGIVVSVIAGDHGRRSVGEARDLRDALRRLVLGTLLSREVGLFQLPGCRMQLVHLLDHFDSVLEEHQVLVVGLALVVAQISKSETCLDLIHLLEHFPDVVDYGERLQEGLVVQQTPVVLVLVPGTDG